MYYKASDHNHEIFRKGTLGVSPGLSNVCASYASKKLDSVNSINISWVAATGPGGHAVALHLFHAMDSEIPIYKDGELKLVSPIKEPKKQVDFPEPFGSVEMPYIGHSEHITLPVFIKGVKNVTVRGALYPLVVQKTLNQIAELGLFSRVPMKVQDTTLTPRDFIMHYFDILMATDGIHNEVQKVLKSLPSPGYGALIVEVEGSQNNNPVKYTYIITADLCDATEWPASIGAQMLAKGEIKQKGVLAPEQCINAETFFYELKKRGLLIKEIKEVTSIM